VRGFIHQHTHSQLLFLAQQLCSGARRGVRCSCMYQHHAREKFSLCSGLSARVPRGVWCKYLFINTTTLSTHSLCLGGRRGVVYACASIPRTERERQVAHTRTLLFSRHAGMVYAFMYPYNILALLSPQSVLSLRETQTELKTTLHWRVDSSNIF